MRTGTDQAWQQAIAVGARPRPLAVPTGCQLAGVVSTGAGVTPLMFDATQSHRPREQST
jgi:hypothetical protein